MPLLPNTATIWKSSSFTKLLTDEYESMDRSLYLKHIEFTEECNKFSESY